MAIERYLHDLIHADPEDYLGTSLDRLTTGGDLVSQVRFFLISCKVDSLSPKTIHGYTQILRAFIKHCRKEHIDSAQQITTDAMRGYILNLQARMKPVSVSDHYRTIKRFLNWLCAENVLTVNPMARIRPPKVPKQVMQAFTADHIHRMLMVCGDSFAGSRDLAILLTFLDTGLRLGELAGIQMGDLDPDKGTIMVTGKGAKQRKVRMDGETQKAVLRYLLRRRAKRDEDIKKGRKPENWPCLWVTEERRPITPDGIRQIIKRIGKRAGVTGTGLKVSPHTFRHTFAILSLRGGMGEFALQRLLGHETLTITRRYTSTLNDEDAIAAHKEASPVAYLRIRIRDKPPR
jgi:integrase/recombinase XerC